MALWLVCQPGLAEAKPPNLPGVDLQDLDADETAILMDVLEQQFGPCGKPRSFLDAVKNPKDCKLATKLANYVVGRVQRGLSKRQIVRALLKEIKRLTVRHKFTVTGRPSVGAAKPRVTVVEFFDFQCPHCRQVAKDIVRLIKKNKGVQLVYKQYPLDFHDAAKPAAIAAIAAHMQGKFMRAHDTLFDHQDTLEAANIDGLLKGAGIDAKRLAADKKRAAKLVAVDKREGDLAGVDGTPSFYVNGIRCEFEELAECIDNALKK